MGSLSNFFPTAGGGGGIGKTITVGDYSYPNARDIDFFAESKYLYYRTAWGERSDYGEVSTNNPSSYSSTLTANNTYSTVVDITSATNGGAFFHFCGWKNQQDSRLGGTITIKVTVDGTANEYSYFEDTTTESSFAIFGNVDQSTNYYLSQGGGGSEGDVAVNIGGYGGQLLQSNYRVADNTVYARGRQDSYDYTNFLQLTAEQYIIKGRPFLHFENSFKLEYKADENYTAYKGNATVHTF
jgi:hypothetical protein